MARSTRAPTPEAPIGPDPWAVPFTDAPPGGLAEPGAAHAPEPRPEPAFSDLALGAKLFQGDALALLDMCRPGIADLIFADPPYFLSNGGFTCQGGRMVPVEKGAWDKSRSFEEDHAFNMAWLDACRRVLKPNGTLFVSGTAHNIYSVGFALQSLGYKILNDIAWFKVNPPPNLACRYFTHATETILWAKKDEKAKHTFNYDIMRAMPDPAPNKQMLSLWRITPPAKVEKRYGKHPTQKPEALLERIVLAASDPGQVVLDPFCGSGTTGVACIRHGRRFIGFDMEAEYLAVAQKRLEDERSQLFAGQQKGAA
jgi:site-specific DNA-methyltransferase (adenine-specific)